MITNLSCTTGIKEHKERFFPTYKLKFENPKKKANKSSERTHTPPTTLTDEHTNKFKLLNKTLFAWKLQQKL